MAWIWTWCALACFTILLTPSYCVRRRNWFLGRQEKPSDTPAVPSYKINYFTQRLDHFNVADERTFQQRYLVNDEYWDKLGPILLYTGNEGEITLFWNNTGFAFDLSAKLNALVIFIEHRYYGDSLPFGQASYQDKEHLGYLASEQALADYAFLITEVKNSIYNTTSPVIAIGGSYGGMLAAWMRMKYPHVVIGALAASAPIWWFTDLTPCDSAYVTITHDFETATPDWPNNPHTCSETIKRSWSAFQNITETGDQGTKWLSEKFSLCQPLQHVSQLVDWVVDTWFNLAMSDYPFPASFLEPLPAWPIKEICKLLSKPLDSDEEVIEAIASAVGIYYNYTGKTECNNLNDSTPSSLAKGWNFQACTEMVMPMCSLGLTDNSMFPLMKWDLESYAKGCYEEYGVSPQPYYIETVYGGKNISAHSNIIFSNGLLDPWHGGGVLESISDTIIALIIPNGAHHLDLRSPSKNDPIEVIFTRHKEMELMTKWINDHNKHNSPTSSHE